MKITTIYSRPYTKKFAQTFDECLNQTFGINSAAYQTRLGFVDSLDTMAFEYYLRLIAKMYSHANLLV